MIKYEYPCTENIPLKGFGEYLEKEIAEPRRNIRLFGEELTTRFAPKHLTLVNSGSSANLVAALMLAEKVKKQGKSMTAIASAFTFPTTLSALILAGFDVTLIDCEKNGFNINPALLPNENIPSVIAVTHFLGFPCDMAAIRQYADVHGCLVLQDACETLDLRQTDGSPYHSVGDITTWSFYHPHHLSSYGGGAVITINKEDFILAESVAHWGRACKCHIDEKLCQVPSGPAHQFTYERLGVNVEISELNACFGRWQLRNWDDIERRRNENYDILYNAMSGNKNLFVWKKPDIGGTPFVFPIRLVNGMTIDNAFEILSAKSIEIRTLMGGASNTQPAFKDCVAYNDIENAVKMSRDTFFVGIHHTLSPKAVRFIAHTINESFI